MLEAEGLCKSYDGRPVLSPVSFQAAEGIGLALLGENGSGKSTLLRLLAQVEAPDRGALRWKGRSVLGDKRFLRAQVGYVPQEPALDAALTVAEQLRLWQAACGCRRNPECEALMDLEPLMGSRIRSLSGGQARRVSIAMALMNRPEILLMDEATAGLDAAHAEALMQWLGGHLARGGVLIWATHHMEEARRLCRVGLRLAEGKPVS